MPTHRESTRLASLSHLGTKAHFITICCNHRLPHLKACKTAQRGDLHSPEEYLFSGSQTITWITKSREGQVPHPAVFRVRIFFSVRPCVETLS